MMKKINFIAAGIAALFLATGTAHAGTIAHCGKRTIIFYGQNFQDEEGKPLEEKHFCYSPDGSSLYHHGRKCKVKWGKTFTAPSPSSYIHGHPDE